MFKSDTDYSASEYVPRKLITFDSKQKIFKREIIKDVTKNQYTKKITNIKNEKIKNSLLKLSNLLKNNEK